MKIMKKIAAVTIAAAALFAFAGCSDADDPNEMINGSNKVYTIDYTNESKDISRGYHSTAYKHAGAAVQLDFENVSKNVNAGVMGLIFDLEEKDGVKSFNVIGVKTNNANGELGYYVSRFENVTDIQAENFGTELKENPAKETVYVTAFAKAKGVKDAEKDTITVYAYAIEKLNESSKKYEYKVYLLYADRQIGKLDKDGNLVAEDGTAIDLSGVEPVATIPTEYTGSQPTQRKLAVYANVYAGKTLKGTWTYRGDYKEVGVDED